MAERNKPTLSRRRSGWRGLAWAVAVSGLILSTPSHAQQSGVPDLSIFEHSPPFPNGFMTVGLFLKRCENASNDPICTNYVIGLVDGFDALDALVSRSPWLCLPQGTKGPVILEGFVKTLVDFRRKTKSDDLEGFENAPVSRYFHIHARSVFSCLKGTKR